MKKLIGAPIRFSINYPKTIIAVYVILTLIFISFIPSVKVDTDPENMLSKDEPVRLAHSEAKRDFALYDSIVVGVVDDESTEGVFLPETLLRIARVTEGILKIEGVIASDVFSLITTDDISSDGVLLTIEPLMETELLSNADALRVRDRALDNPILRDMLVSADGKAVLISVPIKEKSESYRISLEIEEIIRTHGGSEDYHLAGLPIAEDTFGVEMFKQMGVSAPLAGLIIMLIMFYFFRSAPLVIASMAVSIMTVAWSMGFLIGAGYTVHIMSSMIPIFLMPVAVLDSIHILSSFHERFPVSKDRREALEGTIDELLSPMIFTSITSAVGFAALMLTPIPPVRVFGGFVAFGIIVAWFMTMTFLPAVIMLLPVSTLKSFGAKVTEGRHTLQLRIGAFATKRAKWILALAAVVLIVSIYGITRTNVNDNPVKWFESSHPIRVADKVLNEHFGGTYMAYLILGGSEEGTMKRPEVLGYIESLQGHMDSLESVGKTTSVVDVIEKIGYELYDGDESKARVPEDSKTVAQYLFLYEMSGDPDDLYHLIDPTLSKVNIWVQLKSGDNEDMKAVELSVRDYMAANPLPMGIEANWAGLTYLNVVWQDKMVGGMLKSLGSGAVVVFLMMAFLFRSPLWGLISMLPLTLTIAFIYGLIGFSGQDYNMPIAILSSLTLGISVDFAIHFAQRMRQVRRKAEGADDWSKSVSVIYGEPVSAILRNMLVISVAFLPLFLSSLMPYKTVGFFFAAIMTVSGATTLVLLPSVMTLFKRQLKL